MLGSAADRRPSRSTALRLAPRAKKVPNVPRDSAWRCRQARGARHARPAARLAREHRRRDHPADPAEEVRLPGDPGVRDEVRDERTAEEKQDDDAEYNLAYPAIEQSAADEVGCVAKDDATRADRHGSAGRGEPDPEPAHKRHDQGHQEQASRPGECDRKAKDEERNRVPKQVREAQVQEGRVPRPALGRARRCRQARQDSMRGATSAATSSICRGSSPRGQR
jgi:hypothetical protein